MAQTRVPSAVPSAATPGVDDGSVHSLVQVGRTLIAGGTFSEVNDPGSVSTLGRYNAFAFSASSGAVTGFAPQVNGEVDSLAPGPTSATVFLAGAFTSVDGHEEDGLALVDIATGYLVSKFHSPAMNGAVTAIVRDGDKIIVGGYFTTVNGVAHRGLVEIGAAGGAVSTGLRVQLWGHHNFAYNCTPAPGTKCAVGSVGVKALALSPDHATLVAIGNFRYARSRPGAQAMARDQIVRITMRRHVGTVDLDWATATFSTGCATQAYDSWVRNVSFSPDGSYFVVITTGSGRKRQYCDSVTRFNANTTGRKIHPVWADLTGGDSMYGLALTGSAIYVGGHQRWMNNYYGHGSAGAGAVPRPGLAAHDPLTGLPLAWNPGRDPRGVGILVIIATQAGIWIGSDTTHIGPPVGGYTRPRIAFFPLAGGSAPKAGKVGALPNDILALGRFTQTNPASVGEVNFTGVTASAGTSVSAPTDTNWNRIHGATVFDDTLLYGRVDSHGHPKLYERSYNGHSWGPQAVVDPYHDPVWDRVQTGSGQTYNSRDPLFYAEIPTVTGMFYWHGRLYYTKKGSPDLFYRPFSPDSMVIGRIETAVSRGVNFTRSSGIFETGGRLYWSDRTGRLHTVAFNGAPNGTPHVIANADGFDWRARGLAVEPLAPHSGNKPPVVTYTQTRAKRRITFL